MQNPERYPLYQVNNGLLSYLSKGTNWSLTARLVIPNGKIGQCTIVEILLSHCHEVTGHLGSRKLRIYVRNHFSWPSLLAEAEKFCSTYEICAIAKSAPWKPAGFAHPLEIPA